MIKLSENMTALVNLKTTIEAMQNLKELISYYSVDKPGPAYMTADYNGHIIDLQFDRYIAVNAMKEQYQILYDYLSELEIEADL
jgi:hypothetical protein